MKTTLAEILKQIAPLPYGKQGMYGVIDVDGRDALGAGPLLRREATAAYLVHAANELPKLIYAAQALLRADERPPDERNLIEAIAAMGFLRDTLKQATTIEI